jgi:hypothetical protein
LSLHRRKDWGADMVVISILYIYQSMILRKLSHSIQKCGFDSGHRYIEFKKLMGEVHV